MSSSEIHEYWKSHLLKFQVDEILWQDFLPWIIPGDDLSPVCGQWRGYPDHRYEYS